MRSGFEVHTTSVFVLFLREIRTRFGRYRLGYLWALLQPIFQLLVLLTLARLFAGDNSAGISHSTFFVGGIIPWYLFNKIGIQSLNAIRANAGLFNYRPVKPIDSIIARTLLEIIIYSTVYFLLIVYIWIVGDTIEINNIAFLIIVFLTVGWFSMGAGLIIMAVGNSFPESDKIVPILMRLFYIISGVFFSVENMPIEYRKYVLWNPLTHAFELNRNALYGRYESPDASFIYLLFCALVINVLGLMMYRAREKRMVST
jgi:capsular polysaccharide transport system permease protein